MEDGSIGDRGIEALDFASDFTRFLKPEATDEQHRAALRHLWATSELFGRSDGLDVYCGDYRSCAAAEAETS